MNTSLKKFLASSLLLSGSLLSGASFADEEHSKWYIGAGIGFNKLGDMDNTAATAAGPANPGPLCGLLSPLPLPQELCTLLGGSNGTPGSTSSVTTSFDPGLALSGSVGYQLTDHWRPELALSYLSSDVKSITANGTDVSGATGKVSSLNVLANAWYDFRDPSSTWRPYAGIGLGFNQVSASNVGVSGGTFADGSAMVMAYQFGAGMSYKLSDRMSLSADYRYLGGSDAEIDNPNGNPTKSGYKDHAVYAGLRYFLSKSDSGEAAASTDEGKKPCSISPEGVPAEALGPDGCPLDADGDGIADYMDECPKTPAGAKVLPNGCALEGDCRKPKEGEEVDANGCAIDMRFVLRGVKFEFDSDRLLPESKLILNGVAETLKAYPKARVQVEGHTDSIGTDAYNLGLSERRSNVVKNYLAGRGVNGDNLTPVGYGEAKPIADNSTEAGREENRRVEFAVVK